MLKGVKGTTSSLCMGFKGNDEFPYEFPYDCASFYRRFSWCRWLPYILGLLYTYLGPLFSF